MPKVGFVREREDGTYTGDVYGLIGDAIRRNLITKSKSSNHSCPVHPEIEALAPDIYKKLYDNSTGPIDYVVPESKIVCSRKDCDDSHYFYVHFKGCDMEVPKSFIPPAFKRQYCDGLVRGWLILEAEFVV
jgi:hypothetical protein